MFVLHSDCNNVWSKCRYCSGSDSQKLQQPSEPSTESVVNSSADTGYPRNIAGDDKTPEQQQILLSTTRRSSNNESINAVNVEASTDSPAEQMKQRIIEIISQNDHILEEEATDVKAAAISVSQKGDDGVIVVAEPKNDQLPDPDGIEEKYEGQLKEEKDPVMGADLILLDFDISLVHNQSRVEALLLCHTFIGSAYRSSSKDDVPIIDDTVINVEYQGDNIIGYFDRNGNHAFESSGGQRRLYGAVYSVRKYQQSVDIETVYAVIIWIDAAVKEKAEIEITSFEDYFELLKVS